MPSCASIQLILHEIFESLSSIKAKQVKRSIHIDTAIKSAYIDQFKYRIIAEQATRFFIVHNSESWLCLHANYVYYKSEFPVKCAQKLLSKQSEELVKTRHAFDNMQPH